MKAVVLTAYGDIDKLDVRDIPTPEVDPNDVKVRMAGAGVNPVDWKLRSGALQSIMPLDFPAVLGRDASGEVVEVGPGVNAFKIGSRVMGLVRGAYAEFVVAPADAWAEVPAMMDLVDAAALPLVLLTGAQLVEEAVDPKDGDRLLVTGAVGSVGRTAVFVAKARGAKVWAGVRRAQREHAARLDVEGVVALEDLADIATLPQLDSLVDTVGGDGVNNILSKVRPGGTVASVVGEPAGAKGLGLVFHGMTSHPDSKRLAELAQAVAEGKLVIPIATRLPLSEAGKAERLAERGAGGKVILMA